MDTSSKKEMHEKRKVKKKMSKAQIQLAIIKKKQCDAKALIIVEQLLEPEIDSQWLLSNLMYINKSHMEDVIEERAIIKLCGYVLCNKPLTVIMGQQYHISTKNNKVYDITRRKNFCSSRCYGACNYILEQMFTSPLWLRDKEEIPKFKILLSKDELEKSILGDEICVKDANIITNSEDKNEHKDNNITFDNLKSVPYITGSEDNAFYEYSESNVQQNIENIKDHAIVEEKDILRERIDKDPKNLSISANAIKQDHIMDTDPKNLVKIISSLDVDSNKNTEEKKEASDENKNQNDLSNMLENVHKMNVEYLSDNHRDIEDSDKRLKTNSKEKNRNSAKENQSTEFYNLTVHIEHSVREWLTNDTICLLSGKEDIRNQLIENIAQHDRYVHLCKKLNKLQLKDEKEDRVELSTSALKPLPHLSVLKEEGKKIELKVKAYYKGSMIIEHPDTSIQNRSTDQENDFSPVLPITEAHAPKALRRRIFLDKLNRILPDLLRALSSNKLLPYIYNNEKITLLKALVNTFSLSAANIMFKTVEWNLVGLIIIKMLSMIDVQLKQLLLTKHARMYISMILMSYKLDSNYLDRLVMELTNNMEMLVLSNAASSTV